MYLDPLFVDDNGTCYYRVALTDEDNARGIDGYYKWVYGKWKIYNGTANDDLSLIQISINQQETMNTCTMTTRQVLNCILKM